MQISAEYINDILGKIKSKRPIIHCITNFITANDCANVLLALGASPTMAHHPEEVVEMTSHCDALVCNMGAVSDYEAMCNVAAEARRLGHPIVIDPVGVAATSFRREKCIDLIEKYRPDCIRGNVSEIEALYNRKSLKVGVDSDFRGQDAKALCSNYAKQINSLVITSGVTDYISDGIITSAYEYGSRLMSGITGAGCMATCIVAAFLSCDNSPESAAAAMILLGISAEISEKKTMMKCGGTMTFRNELIDTISTIKSEDIAERMETK